MEIKNKTPKTWPLTTEKLRKQQWSGGFEQRGRWRWRWYFLLQKLKVFDGILATVTYSTCLVWAGAVLGTPSFLILSSPLKGPRGVGGQPASTAGKSKPRTPAWVLFHFPLSALFLVPLGRREPMWISAWVQVDCSLEPNQFAWFLSVALLLAMPSNS